MAGQTEMALGVGAATREKHCCPVKGCKKGVPYDKLMCPYHWSMVPRVTQHLVYAAWGSGDGVAHANACQEAIRLVNAKVG
jgi:hypothetical protein